MRLAFIAPLLTGSLAFAQGGICHDGDGVYPHSICAKFWKCDNNVAYERDCPASLLWNDRKKECDWPDESLCEDGEVARNGSGASHKSCVSAVQATTLDRSQFLRRLEADYYRIRPLLVVPILPPPMLPIIHASGCRCNSTLRVWPFVCDVWRRRASSAGSVAPDVRMNSSSYGMPYTRDYPDHLRSSNPDQRRSPLPNHR